MVKYRSQNDGDFAEVSNACATYDDTPSLTIQSQAEEADINVMLARMNIGGRMPENPRVPMFGDFTEVRDYKSALDAIRAADAAFMEYPAGVRARFDNDPQKLLLFVEDGRNFDEAVRLGLCKPREIRHGSAGESVREVGSYVGSSAGSSEVGAGGQRVAAGGGSSVGSGVGGGAAASGAASGQR